MIKTEICDMIGIRYPIIQGGLGPFETTNLAAAISNAGALGMIRHPLRPSPDIIRDILQNVVKLTDNPLGVNIRVAKEDVRTGAPQLIDAIIEDYGTENSSASYPEMFTQAGLQSSVAGFCLALPFTVARRPVGFGFGYSTPFLLNLDVLGTGFEAGIDSEQEIQDEIKRIRMRTRLNFDGNVRVRVSQYQFGLGCDVGSGTSVGSCR